MKSALIKAKTLASEYKWQVVFISDWLKKWCKFQITFAGNSSENCSNHHCHCTSVESWVNKEVLGIKVLFDPVAVVKCMAKNLAIMKPCYRWHYFASPNPFAILRFHCCNKCVKYMCRGVVFVYIISVFAQIILKVFSLDNLIA